MRRERKNRPRLDARTGGAGHGAAEPRGSPRGTRIRMPRFRWKPFGLFYSEYHAGIGMSTPIARSVSASHRLLPVSSEGGRPRGSCTRRGGCGWTHRRCCGFPPPARSWPGEQGSVRRGIGVAGWGAARQGKVESLGSERPSVSLSRRSRSDRGTEKGAKKEMGEDNRNGES